MIFYEEYLRAQKSADHLVSACCGWRDLNPHALRHTHLKRTRLPIPPHPRKYSHEHFYRIHDYGSFVNS